MADIAEATVVSKLLAASTTIQALSDELLGTHDGNEVGGPHSLVARLKHVVAELDEIAELLAARSS